MYPGLVDKPVSSLTHPRRTQQLRCENMFKIDDVSMIFAAGAKLLLFTLASNSGRT